jgi:hypothetical protein
LHGEGAYFIRFEEKAIPRTNRVFDKIEYIYFHIDSIQILSERFNKTYGMSSTYKKAGT